jgi:enoyl-CoA hydratase/carnithine racemase
MCTYILPHVVGWPKAKELIFTTRAVGADEALSIGLLNQLVPSENLMEAALEMARMIAVHPRVGESEAKRLMQATANRSLRESFVDECLSLVTTMRSALSQNNIHLHHFHEDADLTAFGVSRSPE